MDEPEKCAWASAYQNQDIIWICTDSGYRSCAYDPRGKETILRPDADGTALGVAVKEALENSRFLSLDEAREFLEYRRAEQKYEARIESLMDSQGYKTRASFFRKMKRCDITLLKGMIKIGPTIHEGLDSWGRNKSDELEDVLVPADAPAEQIGAALKLGLSRSIA